MSSKIFGSLACEDFEDGTSYLKVDYSIDCNADNRGVWVTFAAVAIVIYPLGTL